MQLSRSFRRINNARQNIELLEARCLLSATVTAQVPAQAIDATLGAQTLNLTQFFQDSQVPAGDTVVNIQTTLPAPNNSIPILLTDAATPQTVANFLAYISSGEYANTIVHRSVPGFVIQAGGYTTNGAHITTTGTIPGESSTEILQNATPGTIAMALSTGPNSATSEWYINLGNNAVLDGASDGGPFTVFGQTIYKGLDVAQDIANLKIVNDTTSGAWSTLPVQNFSGANGSTVSSLPANDFVVLNPVVVPGGLNYSVSGFNPNIVSASVSNGSLTLTPIGGGTTQVTVTATDLGGGTATSTFSVHVTNAPAVADLTPAASGSVPASVIAGQKAAISQTVTLTNTSGSAYDASASTQLFLSTGTTIDGSSISLPAQLTKTEKLKTGAHVSFKLSLKSLPATVPAGTYHVLAQVTDSKGNTAVAASDGTISVVPPQIDLSASIAKFAATAKAAKKFTETITVANTDGNIPAAGSLPILVETSPDGNTSDATPLTTITKKINIKPGKSITIPLSLTAPASGTSAFLVFQLDPNNTFADINLANNIVVSASPVIVS